MYRAIHHSLRCCYLLFKITSGLRKIVMFHRFSFVLSYLFLEISVIPTEISIHSRRGKNVLKSATNLYKLFFEICMECYHYLFNKYIPCCRASVQ